MSILQARFEPLSCRKWDTRENWADTIIHDFNRLAMSSTLSVNQIYKAVCGLVSDAASVNVGLAKEID